MAKTNRERVQEGLLLLARGLKPFIECEMKSVYKDRWQEEAEKSLFQIIDSGKEINWDDPYPALLIMWDHWNHVFKNTLGHPERSLVSELRDTRNRWAHMEPFSSDDAYRALDSIGRLLAAVSASETGDIDKQKMELLRVRFDEQRRNVERRSQLSLVEGQPVGNLKPWREIITPHPDVASGKYQQAEFAADLWQVYLQEGSDEYRDPSEFYRRTFLTEGLTDLLKNALNRLSGQGGDPVVELQTNFGGGKTHSMLALYHLFSGASTSELQGVEDILSQSDVPEVPENVQRAVFVGTKIPPGKVHRKPDGTEVRTMWGEIAWQLGGREGYEFVREADETATNPGDAMRELFDHYSPCLILIDEWVAYARQLHDDMVLPAGTFSTQFTFAQALAESVKASRNTLLVVSIPASDSMTGRAGEESVSDIEVGGQRGREALERLKNVIGRVESSWRPASQDEGFEIVRRRLFQPIQDPSLYAARDYVVRAFSEWYRSQHQDFPSICREASYERRMKAAYPIHPELFERLYNDWSTLEKFQRTRGVLRLMASVIHSLWERGDSNLLIMPATIPIDDSRVQFELTRYLEEGWVPVIEKDVDGPHSLPLALDRENPSLGKYSACRRVARTIYVGSAPVQHVSNKGIDDRQVRLGSVQPGEQPATFGDALRRLTDKATYLYVDGSRYWYSTQPTVTRLAEDRAAQIRDADVLEEIRQRVRTHSRSRGDFSKVHSCVSSGDVPDEKEARLVVLDPEFTHTNNGTEDSGALNEAEKIFENRGTSPRIYRNTLVFLAADKNRMNELKQAVRLFLAWDSIWKEKEELNLDYFQTQMAENKKTTANNTVEARIPETYQWVLVPTQPNAKGAVEWLKYRQQGHDALAVRVSKKLKTEELLISEYSGTRLRLELDRIPLWRGNHVRIKQLLEDFATFLYLPRLKNENVFLDAIRSGVSSLQWESETFAYAEGFDETTGKYRGLVAGKNARIVVDSESLLVKPEVALKQIEAETEHSTGGKEVVSGGEGTKPEIPVGGPHEKEEKTVKRFYGTVKLKPLGVGSQAGKISEEIIQHIEALPQADVEILLEIQANVPEGVPENVVRIVSENCRTLQFEKFEFEEE
jgi:hypothetical protein